MCPGASISEAKEKYVCTTCNKDFSNSNSLRAHKAENHSLATKCKLLNEFERQYCSITYKPLKYFYMKKAYMNRINM